MECFLTFCLIFDDDLYDKVTFEQKLKVSNKGVRSMLLPRGRVSNGIGSSKHRGPEAEANLVCSRNFKGQINRIGIYKVESSRRQIQRSNGCKIMLTVNILNLI